MGGVSYNKFYINAYEFMKRKRRNWNFTPAAKITQFIEKVV